MIEIAFCNLKFPREQIQDCIYQISYCVYILGLLDIEVLYMLVFQKLQNLNLELRHKLFSLFLYELGYFLGAKKMGKIDD